MDMKETENILESLLFASGNPISISQLTEIMDSDTKTVSEAMTNLAADYEKDARGIRIIKLDDKYQLVSSPSNSDYVKRLLDNRRNPMLSQAAMEVLALIAYNQPVTRAYVEQVRGVDSAAVIHNLIDKELVEEKGKLDAPGRPLLYGTTANFMRVFGISTLSELPELPEIKAQNEENTEEE